MSEGNEGKDATKVAEDGRVTFKEGTGCGCSVVVAGVEATQGKEVDDDEVKCANVAGVGTPKDSVGGLKNVYEF